MASLLLDSDLNPEQRECAEIMHTSGQALLGVIGDVLDFSKIESGKFVLELRALDIRACVEETLDLFASLAAEKGLSLAYEYLPGCPETCTSDPTRLRQILVNLAGNAIKFTEQGDVDIRVERAGDMLRFTVRDTGIGIPVDLQGRLFQAFSQVDSSTTRRFGGTGLGLAICARLAKMLGGDIGVESAAGRGSEFSFTIAYEPGEPRARPKAWLNGKVAALVDSSEAVTRGLESLLGAWGMSARRFATLREALSATAEQSVELVVVDVSLAADVDLVGIQTPLLFTTSLRNSHEASQRGPHVVAKPVKRAKLAAALHAVLGGEGPSINIVDQRSSERDLDDLQAARVLVVDDSAINQKVALRLLGRLGCTADVAENGAVAVEMLHSAVYDVIFMDVQMPVLDGLETTRELRARASLRPQPWIIAMTAEALSGDEARCRAAGMDDYITKPVRLASLAAALRRGLSARVTQAQPVSVDVSSPSSPGSSTTRA
jgi:CheY-like chemotaxis protein